MSENAIYDRRSIRKYQDREVPTEYIEQLIDAGSRGNILCIQGMGSRS